jgi:LexA-binding, inner membrane-associated putative hydrolase
MRSDRLDSAGRWAYPILLAGVALLFDAAERRTPFGILRTAPLDELAHLATAALGLMVVACFIDAPRRFYAAGLIASVAIDVDHIPLYLGLLNGGQRPVTHSLATVLVFVAAAAVSRRHRAVLAGIATGLAFHFARDIAEGSPGVRLLWPLQQTAWTASYWWFLGMIVAFTAIRLVLVSSGLPGRRVRLFQSPPPSRPVPPDPGGRLDQGDRVLAPELEGPGDEDGGQQRR